LVKVLFVEFGEVISPELRSSSLGKSSQPQISHMQTFREIRYDLVQ